MSLSHFALLLFALCHPPYNPHKLTEPLIVCQVPKPGMHLSKPLANRTEGQCCCGSHKSIGSYIPLSPCLSSSCWRSFQVQIQSVGHTSIYEKHSIISSVLSLSTVFTPLFEAEKQSSCAAYSSYNSSDSLRHRVVSTVLGVTLLWKKIDAFPPW